MATFYLREEQHRRKLERKTTENETLEIGVDDLTITQCRSLGPELVCHHT